MKEAPAFTFMYNLGRLPQAGESVAIAANETQCAAIARWAGLAALEKLDAAIGLRKLSPTRFALEGKFTADLIQSCVVTLEPVPAHIERSFARELHFTGKPRRQVAPSPEGASFLAQDEEPEEIEDLHYDLAFPLLEEFSLALDPYPRKPGVSFEAPAEPARGTPKNPFAVLGRLKSRP